MTNREDGDVTPNCKPRMAALLAVHLVSQILDEAYIIANAARESGQPWQCMSMLKSFKAGRLDMEDEEPSYEVSKTDCDLNENKIGIVANVVATSTPQKLTKIDCSDETEVLILHNDAPLIGQGDEDLEIHQNELTNSTSMFINQLFDMSDVECIVICEDTEVVQKTAESEDIFPEAVNKIIDLTTNTETPDETLPLVPNVQIISGTLPTELSRSDSSDYSVLADAFVADITRDVAFYIEDECEKRKAVESYETAVVEEIKEVTYTIQQDDENSDNKIKDNDVALYENAYVTLNRDYDQGSEEDGFPVLQDPKGMSLQEVQLMTANTSDEDLSYPDIRDKQRLQGAVPTTSGISSQKGSIIRRCRVQSARLLACIRGWWHRKTPGKRKESRGPVTSCPLSPDARRRASSLMDNRLLRSPSPSRPLVWKFNTVNEAMVSSNRWKDYTYEVRPDDY